MIQRRATVDDLYSVEGPAELVGGRIVHDMTGEQPGDVAFNIAVSLRAYARQTGRGKAHADGIGYVARVEASDRDSFCPDASYHTHPPAANPMRFIEQCRISPSRSAARTATARPPKRSRPPNAADYFAAGTLVVWDVDPVKEVVTVYRAAEPNTPTTFRRGATADAEPAVPEWRMAVDEVFAWAPNVDSVRRELIIVGFNQSRFRCEDPGERPGPASTCWERRGMLISRPAPAIRPESGRMCLGAGDGADAKAREPSKTCTAIRDDASLIVGRIHGRQTPVSSQALLVFDQLC